MRKFILGTDWWSDCDDAVAIRLLVKVLGIGAVSRLLACYMSWRQKRRKA